MFKNGRFKLKKLKLFGGDSFQNWEQLIWKAFESEKKQN